MGGLDRGDRRLGGLGQRDELSGTTSGAGPHVEVIPDEQQEGLVTGELAGAPDRVAVAEGFGLFDELEAPRMGARGRAVGGGVPGADHDTDLVDPSVQGLLDDDRERRLGGAITVHQRLEREGALMLSRGGDHGLLQLHSRH